MMNSKQKKLLIIGVIVFIVTFAFIVFLLFPREKLPVGSNRPSVIELELSLKDTNDCFFLRAKNLLVHKDVPYVVTQHVGGTYKIVRIPVDYNSTILFVIKNNSKKFLKVLSFFNENYLRKKDFYDKYMSFLLGPKKDKNFYLSYYLYREKAKTKEFILSFFFSCTNCKKCNHREIKLLIGDKEALENLKLSYEEPVSLHTSTTH